MKEILCSFIGHSWEGDGYTLEKIELTHEVLYYGLQICSRCGMTKFESYVSLLEED